MCKRRSVETQELIKVSEEGGSKTLLLVGVDRSLARTFLRPPWGRDQPNKAIVTTRNQGSQQNHFGEDPMTMLAEMKQEEDRMRHADAL